MSLCMAIALAGRAVAIEMMLDEAIGGDRAVDESGFSWWVWSGVITADAQLAPGVIREAAAIADPVSWSHVLGF